MKLLTETLEGIDAKIEKLALDIVREGREVTAEEINDRLEAELTENEQDACFRLGAVRRIMAAHGIKLTDDEIEECAALSRSVYPDGLSLRKPS